MQRSWLKSAGKAILIALLWVAIMFSPGMPLRAAGGFALSGSFSTYKFEMPQNSSIISTEVYVVVFNNTEKELNVRMIAQSPLGIKIAFTPENFVLQAMENKKVEISIEVTSDVAPGEYEISVTAEPYKKENKGIQILGAASQSARIVVLGEGAQITARVVNSDGELIPSVVRLTKVVNGQRYEIAYSENGILEAKVAPGSYIVGAYIKGEKVKEQSFEIEAGKRQTLDLVVTPLYFEEFEIVPVYRGKTEEIAFAHIVYAIKNLDKPIGKAEVVLCVSLNETEIERISLVTLNPLDLGRSSFQYNYLPDEGWREGNYIFQLQLYDGEKLCAFSMKKQLKIGPRSLSSFNLDLSVNLLMPTFIVVGVILLAIMAILIIRKRKD